MPTNNLIKSYTLSNKTCRTYRHLIRLRQYTHVRYSEYTTIPIHSNLDCKLRSITNRYITSSISSRYRPTNDLQSKLSYLEVPEVLLRENNIVEALC